MAKKSNNRPNVTNNTNIVSISGVGSDSFNSLLQLQEKSVENLQTISSTLRDSLLTQRALAIEELILSRETLDEQRVLKDISKTLETIAHSLKDILAASIVSTGGTSSSSNASTAITTKSKEDKNEAQRSEDEKTGLLKQIAKNTTPKDGNVKPSKEEGGGLGGWLTALAATLGVVVGAMRAQLKSIAYFAKVFAPETFAKVRKAIGSFLSGVSMTFDIAKDTISEKFTKALKFVDGLLDSVKGVFGNVTNAIKKILGMDKEGSTVVKIIKSISSVLSTIMSPFVEAFNVVKELMTGPESKIFKTVKSVFSSAFEGVKGFFTTIGETFGKFGSVFKSVAAIAEKVFLPITILMTVWDTVKGAMEGYEKDGLVGAISGAIKGFFNSLIFGPIDMVKDAIAWVAGVFGFENAKKTLESFSVEKIFSDFVDMIFSPVKTFKNIVTEVMNSLAKLSDFTIPEIGFTIPYINKKVSVGPWKPLEGFANPGSSAGQTVSPSNVAPSSSSNTSATVTSQSSEVGAMKEKSNATTTIVSAPSVSNNMQQTQVAKIEAPIRSNESSFDRYIGSRAVY